MGRFATQPNVNRNRCSARIRSSWVRAHNDPGMRAIIGRDAKAGGKNRSRQSDE